MASVVPWRQSGVSGLGHSLRTAQSLILSISSWQLCSISTSVSWFSTSISSNLCSFSRFSSSSQRISSCCLWCILWHSSDLSVGTCWSSESRRDPPSSSQNSLWGPLSSQSSFRRWQTSWRGSSSRVLQHSLSWSRRSSWWSLPLRLQCPMFVFFLLRQFPSDLLHHLLLLGLRYRPLSRLPSLLSEKS